MGKLSGDPCLPRSSVARSSVVTRRELTGRTKVPGLAATQGVRRESAPKAAAPAAASVGNGEHRRSIIGALTSRVVRRPRRNSAAARDKLTRHMKRVVVDHFYQRWKLLKNVRHVARLKQRLSGWLLLLAMCGIITMCVQVEGRLQGYFSRTTHDVLRSLTLTSTVAALSAITMYYRHHKRILAETGARVGFKSTRRARSRSSPRLRSAVAPGRRAHGAS